MSRRIVGVVDVGCCGCNGITLNYLFTENQLIIDIYNDVP